MAAAAAAFANVSAVAGQKRAREVEAAESPGRNVRAASGGFQPQPMDSDEDEGSDECSDEDMGHDLVLEDGGTSASGSGSGSGSGSDEETPTEEGNHASVRVRQPPLSLFRPLRAALKHA